MPTPIEPNVVIRTDHSKDAPGYATQSMRVKPMYAIVMALRPYHIASVVPIERTNPELARA